MLDKQSKSIITEMVVRTMRHGGFTGDLTVSHIRLRKDGAYTARVLAVVGGGMGRATYRATVKDSKIKVSRVSDIVVNIPV